MSPQTESALHALGVYHFDQIADWSRANVAWLDQYLRLRGRILREQWVEQARTLVHGTPAGRRLYFETETV
jgi:NADH-quinone oxidoreductase subunit E